MTSFNWAIIGDIHSQSEKLQSSIDYCKSNNLRPIFLGDLFDSRCSFSDSVSVYEKVKLAQKELNAIVLQSNHQHKLIRYLHGEYVTENYGFCRTINDFGLKTNNPKIDSQELLNWLESFPYSLIFKDKEGNQYRASHAYFPTRLSEIVEGIFSIEKEDIIQFHEKDFYATQKLSIDYKAENAPRKSFRKLQERIIYGPAVYSKVEKMPKVNWWNKKNNRTWTMVVGHYHTVHIDFENKSLVLDAGCGNEGGKLALFELDNKKLILF
jgi:hypothetical protein